MLQEVFSNFTCLCNRFLQFDHAHISTHKCCSLPGSRPLFAGLEVGGQCALWNGGSDQLAPSVSRTSEWKYLKATQFSMCTCLPYAVGPRFVCLFLIAVSKELGLLPLRDEGGNFSRNMVKKRSNLGLLM